MQLSTNAIIRRWLLSLNVPVGRGRLPGVNIYPTAGRGIWAAQTVRGFSVKKREDNATGRELGKSSGVGVSAVSLVTTFPCRTQLFGST